MIKHIINWIKALFSKKEEPVIVEETVIEKELVDHCLSHLRFRKNCPDCLRIVGSI